MEKEPADKEKSKLTYGERIDAIKKSVEETGLADPAEVRKVRDAIASFAHIRAWAADGDLGVSMNEEHGVWDDVAYLNSLLPEDENQGQLSL